LPFRHLPLKNLNSYIKEQELKDVLLAIRENKKTPVQAKWLQKFQWQNLTSSYGQGLLNDMSEKGEHREELLATCKKSYKQVNQVLGITAHYPLEK
jgi:hypothetical protein